MSFSHFRTLVWEGTRKPARDDSGLKSNLSGPGAGGVFDVLGRMCPEKALRCRYEKAVCQNAYTGTHYSRPHLSGLAPSHRCAGPSPLRVYPCSDRALSLLPGSESGSIARAGDRLGRLYSADCRRYRQNCGERRCEPARDDSGLKSNLSGPGAGGVFDVTIPVRISPDLLRRVDAQGRIRSKFIRAAIEYYLYCLDRNRGALVEEEIALGGCTVHIVDAAGSIVASGPVSRPAMTED